MKRSLVVLSTSFPRFADDDAGIFVLRLVKALSEEGYNGTVIAPKDISAEELSKVGNFTVRRFRYGVFTPGKLAFGAGIIPNLRQNLLLLFQIPFFLLSFLILALKQTNRHSIIQANWLISGFIAWIVSLIKNAPYVITIRGEDLRLLRAKSLRFLFAPCIRAADAVITVSESLKNEFDSYELIPKKKVSVIENGADSYPIDPAILREFKQSKNISDQPFLLFVGTIIPRKNIAETISILAEKSLRDYSLRICGRLSDSSEFSRITKLIADLKLEERVFFEGAVSPTQIPYYLTLASAYITTSEFEGRPNSVLEALAYGKLVCASDIPAHQELIRDRENGVILKADFSSENAEKIRGLLANKELLSQITHNAKLTVAQLSWQSSAKIYGSLFEKISLGNEKHCI